MLAQMRQAESPTGQARLQLPHLQTIANQHPVGAGLLAQAQKGQLSHCLQEAGVNGQGFLRSPDSSLLRNLASRTSTAATQLLPAYCLS